MDFVGVVDGKATRRHWHRRAMISVWAPARPPRAFKHQDIACFLGIERLAHMARGESYSHEVGTGLRRVSGQTGDRQVRADPAHLPVYYPPLPTLHYVLWWLVRCVCPSR